MVWQIRKADENFLPPVKRRLFITYLNLPTFY